jgi:hypothetical protein
MPQVKRQLNGETLKPISIAAATGWYGLVTGESHALPLVAWALLPDGEMIGLVERGGAFVSVEQLLNFGGFLHKPPPFETS